MKVVSQLLVARRYLLAYVIAAGAVANAATPSGRLADAAAAPPKPLRVVIAFEPVDGASNSMTKSMNMEAPMSKALGVPVSVSGERNLREIAIGTRSGEYDALWVPSNLAVSAIKDPQYELVGFDGHMTAMALLVAPDIQKFEDLKGRTLYLPQEDSSASSVGTALLSDHGMKVGDFRVVYTSGTYEIAAFAITNTFCSATAMPADTAKALVASNPKAGRVIETSSPVPGQTLVVKKSLSATRKKQLADWAAAQAGVPALVTATAEPFKYITGLSHYTPEDVAGVKKVSAQEVVTLVKGGAKLIDVRSAGEYQMKHLPEAQLVPYVEESPRYVGANMTNDDFDLSKLAGTRKVVLYCNGPECWKSFKAATRAISSRQFDAVYWFRGGIPEWERSGLRTVGGGAVATSN